ncbi:MULTISPECIES: hypothetical protein [Bacillus cereus group]|uniref:hypothetical protein n=1 Tax=Bacillus cereus group TaxID=86661 RepID=UPI000BF8C2D9|nr:hypothetical protein [Bacillus mycoides]MCM0006120.1 hypothetical protein [Bacillus paranthracis]PGA05644.1 hypothetical protein COL71_25965 [Bacillus mycoides]
MAKVQVEMEQEDLLAIIGTLIKVQSSYGVNNERFTALVTDLTVQAGQLISSEDLATLISERLSK